MSTLLIDGFGQGSLLVTDGFSDAIVHALSVNPGRINPSATTTISFISIGTHWLDDDPTFSASGAPTADGSWALGTKTIVDNTHATLVVTTGATRGTVTWTDSTTGQTTPMTAAPKHPRIVFSRQRRMR